MIATIISYCNNDFQFIEENLQQASKFSNEIFISYCDYALNGILEDEDTLEKMFEIAKKYNATPITIEYQKNETSRFHHNIMRFLPTWSCKSDYILFLDADEIIEGDLFKKYLKTKDHENYDVVSLECYWYFRERKYRAKTTEEAGVMCKKSICTYNYIFSDMERWEFKRREDFKSKRWLRQDNKVLCHHYSWVRTKEQMLRKVKSWGHNKDLDWVSLIEEEFSHDFNGTDFVHNYEYDVLDC